MFGFAEQIESFGLAWKCPFQGNALEAYSSVAPYLIELRSDNPFVSKLLRPIGSKDAVGQSSALNCGIFIASSASLDGLRLHLRKFTMRESEPKGKRVNFRFYGPFVFRTLDLVQGDRSCCGKAEQLAANRSTIRTIKCFAPDQAAYASYDPTSWKPSKAADVE